MEEERRSVFILIEQRVNAIVEDEGLWALERRRGRNWSMDKRTEKGKEEWKENEDGMVWTKVCCCWCCLP